MTRLLTAIHIMAKPRKKKKIDLISGAPERPIEFEDDDEAINQNAKPKGRKHYCEQCYSNCDCGSFDSRICRLCTHCHWTYDWHSRLDASLNHDRNYTMLGDDNYVYIEEEIPV